MRLMKTGRVDLPEETYPIVLTQYLRDSESRELSKEPSALRTMPVFSN